MGARSRDTFEEAHKEHRQLWNLEQVLTCALRLSVAARDFGVAATPITDDHDDHKWEAVRDFLNALADSGRLIGELRNDCPDFVVASVDAITSWISGEIDDLQLTSPECTELTLARLIREENARFVTYSTESQEDEFWGVRAVTYRLGTLSLFRRDTVFDRSASDRLLEPVRELIGAELDFYNCEISESQFVTSGERERSGAGENHVDAVDEKADYREPRHGEPLAEHVEQQAATPNPPSPVPTIDDELLAPLAHREETDDGRDLPGEEGPEEVPEWNGDSLSFRSKCFSVRSQRKAFRKILDNMEDQDWPRSGILFDRSTFKDNPKKLSDTRCSNDAGIGFRIIREDEGIRIRWYSKG